MCHFHLHCETTEPAVRDGRHFATPSDSLALETLPLLILLEIGLVAAQVIDGIDFAPRDRRFAISRDRTRLRRNWRRVLGGLVPVESFSAH
jgi:hypothetical protein